MGHGLPIMTHKAYSLVQKIQEVESTLKFPLHKMGHGQLIPQFTYAKNASQCKDKYIF
jgi:hypothetical protein